MHDLTIRAASENDQLEFTSVGEYARHRPQNVHLHFLVVSKDRFGHAPFCTACVAYTVGTSMVVLRPVMPFGQLQGSFQVHTSELAAGLTRAEVRAG